MQLVLPAHICTCNNASFYVVEMQYDKERQSNPNSLLSLKSRFTEIVGNGQSLCCTTTTNSRHNVIKVVSHTLQ